MFNIGVSEALLIAFVAFFIVGPQRLPKLAAEAGRMLRRLRAMAQDTSAGLRAELGPEFADIDIADLHPRRFVRKHLLEGLDDDMASDISDLGAGPELSSPAAQAVTRPVEAGERPPYDPDAT